MWISIIGGNSTGIDEVNSNEEYLSTINVKLFFQFLDRSYEKCSVILTTNINLKLSDEVFQDSKLANAISDCV
ncbi:hypothetical protein CN899_14825 [Bacillus thuringiensis]|uniref:IstB-like ATP-binding domain-containing protein n=1 Tax=Bacillus thuringiensis TaxID=1428 RepID=A0A9X7BYC2_BACTU|nr:hypothetical protein CN899_14825 [Bacillus thuringiensis]